MKFSAGSTSSCTATSRPTTRHAAARETHAADGWNSVEDFRGIRRDRVVLQSQIRRPAGDQYEGGYEHVEGYAAPAPERTVSA